MSTIAVNAITDAAGGNTATINGTTPTADSLQGFRNRIINGDMRIDQRNNGAAVTINNAGGLQYSVDRFSGYNATSATEGIFTLQQDSDVPAGAGFSNSLKATVTTADASLGATQEYVIAQRIEGFNVADLGLGTAAAAQITLSFWVRSSVTGTFGGSLVNSALNRSYPFSYSISSANTWEKKTITLTGDTSGTWLTTNGTGLQVTWGLGAGSTRSGTPGAWAGSLFLSVTGATNLMATSGATFYLTGVQLEAGSVATPFERRPYGTELALCQRYFRKGTINGGGVFGGSGGSIPIIGWAYPVTMRSAPTMVWISGGNTSNGNASYNITGVLVANAYTDSVQILWAQSGSSGANTQGAMTTAAVSSFSAEL